MHRLVVQKTLWFISGCCIFLTQLVFILNYVIVTELLDKISNDFQRVLIFKSQVHKYPKFPESVFKKRDAIRLLDTII